MKTVANMNELLLLVRFGGAFHIETMSDIAPKHCNTGEQVSQNVYNYPISQA